MTPCNQIDQEIDQATLKGILKLLYKCISYMDNIILYQTIDINSDKKYYASLLYMVKIGEVLRQLKDDCKDIDISQVYGLEWLLVEHVQMGDKAPTLKDGVLIQVRDMIMHGMLYDDATRELKTRELFTNFFISLEPKEIKNNIKDIAKHLKNGAFTQDTQISYGDLFKALLVQVKNNVRYEKKRKKKPGNIQKSINTLSENDQEKLERLRDKLKQRSDIMLHKEIRNIIRIVDLFVEWKVLEKQDPDDKDSLKYTLNTEILDQEVVANAGQMLLAILDASQQLSYLMSRHLSIVSNAFTKKKIERGYRFATSESIQQVFCSSEEQKIFTKSVLTIHQKRNMLVHRTFKPADSRAKLLEALTALIEIIPSLYKLQACIHEAQLQYNDNLRPQQDRGI